MVENAQGIQQSIILFNLTTKRTNIPTHCETKIDDTMNPSRGSRRYPFTATAYVTDELTGSLIVARITDLSLNGCFVQMSSALREGTPITIRIGAGSSVFQTSGKVVHSQPNRGVGVEFQNLEPSYAAVLETWLSEATHLNISEETT